MVYRALEVGRVVVSPTGRSAGLLRSNAKKLAPGWGTSACLAERGKYAEAAEGQRG